MKAALIALLALTFCIAVQARGRTQRVAVIATTTSPIRAELPNLPLPGFYEGWTLVEDRKATSRKEGAKDPLRTPMFRNARPLD
jgi:hypothetical protein